MPEYRAPGVVIDETPTPPPAVAEVATAVPAFAGYTEKAAENSPLDLILTPTKITSMVEFERVFGGPNLEFDPFEISVVDAPGNTFSVTHLAEPALDYILYYSIRLFFSNGGRECYVVSVGTYQPSAVIDLTGDASTNEATRYGLADGLNAIGMADEPTLIVIPEAIKLTVADYQSLVQATLLQCETLQDRFALFDLHGGDQHLDPAALSAVRGLFGTNNLKYAAAYYPFIKTSFNYSLSAAEDNVTISYDTAVNTGLGSLKSSLPALYAFIKGLLKDHFIVLPVAAAVAGAYVANDRRRGVWKAPANVSLANVIEPVVKIDDHYNSKLNVDAVSGKSINAIRAFASKGNLIWGARTLAGNDNEWRYVPVRRFFNMVEESVKKSTEWVVFEPNDLNTWTRLKNLIENYLLLKWREGALLGTTPEQAFYVQCGLGSTMTTQDILNRRLIVEIGMAPVRPAEFVVLRITHNIPAT